MDKTHNPCIETDGNIGRSSGWHWEKAPEIVIGEGMIDCLSLVCIHIVAHSSKESVDILGVASVFQYNNILKRLLPFELWKHSTLCKVEGIEA